MSYLHRASVGSAPAEADTVAPLPARLPRIKSPHLPTEADRRPPRSMPLTRRYEAMWLCRNGDIDSTVRIAPATPLFEEAFSALARGAVLQSDMGPVAVEDVVPGMRVLVADGSFVAVTWVGSMTLYPGHSPEPDDKPVTLTRITADAFGTGRPMPDLVLGPRARICLRDSRLQGQFGLDAAFVPARAFVDGVSVIEVTPAAPVSAYHLVLERQAAIRVMGIEVESYHPGEGIEGMIDPRMLSLFEGLFPQMHGLSGFGPLAHQRLTRFEVEHLFD